jgi:UDP-glucose 4-epimerase
VNILITGGAGFIGKHLSRRLIEDGHDVTVLDSLETSSELPRDVRFIKGSILNESLVSEQVKSSDQVIHLAAAVGVSNIIDSPLRGLKTNVLGSEIVIRTCSVEGKPILLTSSSEVYGKNSSDSLSETSDRVVGVPQKSRWSYSDSKAIEEAFALAYFKEESLDAKIIRLFNTVGPGQVGNYGMVLPRFMNSAMRNNDVEIYGDGKQTRCFMHVSDAVEGILLFMKNVNASGEVINLGNPEEISILDLAAKIVQYTKSTSILKFLEYEDVFGIGFEDMERRVPDISKAAEILGWKPSKTIDDIIRDSHEYEAARR